MEENIWAFGFTAQGGWLYSGPQKWSRYEIPQGMEDEFENGNVKDVHWVSFGCTDECYFFSYLNKDLNIEFICGDDCPIDFLNYFDEEGPHEEDLKVVFGPDESFFAWDSKSIRWSDIPLAMEKSIQRVLRPNGWVHGPPRIVALGADDAWYIEFQDGTTVYNIPSSYKRLRKDLDNKKTKRMLKREGELLYASFSASQPDHYVLVFQDHYYCYNVPDPAELACEVLDSGLSEKTQKLRKAQRERKRNAKQAAERKQARDAEQRKRAKEAEKDKQGQKNLQEQLPLYYRSWKSGYENDIATGKKLTAFPHLPAAVCICRQISCRITKETKEGLKACRHDVEQLLRASGCYSLTWLQKERLQWHPDRFGRRCDPCYKDALQRKTTELFAIFEALITAEKL